ncbi:MAG TPA: hypothetical protein VFW80_06780 [Gaiellaceae bacterium]|nr:hypothetical protein [Gaiellaceae bacterium]
MAHLAWRAQPPDEPSERPSEAPDEEAEVVDLSKQRLLGWLKGMFGGGKQEPPREDR